MNWLDTIHNHSQHQLLMKHLLLWLCFWRHTLLFLFVNRHSQVSSIHSRTLWSVLVGTKSDRASRKIRSGSSPVLKNSSMSSRVFETNKQRIPTRATLHWKILRTFMQNQCQVFHCLSRISRIKFCGTVKPCVFIFRSYLLFQSIVMKPLKLCFAGLPRFRLIIPCFSYWGCEPPKPLALSATANITG